MGKKAKTISIGADPTIEPRVAYQRRVTKLAAEAKAAQERFEDAVLARYAATEEEGSVDATDLILYRGTMTALRADSFDLRTEAERNGWAPPSADVLTHPAREIFGRLWSRGMVNPRLKPGWVNLKPRENAEALARTAHGQGPISKKG